MIALSASSRHTILLNPQAERGFTRVRIKRGKTNFANLVPKPHAKSMKNCKFRVR